jgi:hypothetical protein
MSLLSNTKVQWQFVCHTATTFFALLALTTPETEYCAPGHTMQCRNYTNYITVSHRMLVMNRTFPVGVRGADRYG